MAAQVVRIARALFPNIRTALPYITFPMAVVVGFVGYTAEGYFGGSERKQKANASPTTKQDERFARWDAEMNAAADLAGTSAAPSDNAR
mmetsp:Transcript_16530/g.42907  ORF Transcript_16530/g.42907 Transcript_16530/m.42907 type:complete len:89 (+) Transcript_16530:96-362(+)